MIIWFTGLSGSGKTTLSNCLREKLTKSGYSVFQVDGDIFRDKRKSKNTFTREEILDNNYKIISYCQSLHKDYNFLIVSVISPYEETRSKTREVFAEEYLEIFLDCPLEKLIERDPKELYSKALSGEIKNLIGFSSRSPYEYPEECDLKINTNQIDIKSSLKMIMDLIKQRVQLKK